MKIVRVIASQHTQSRVRDAGTYEAAVEFELDNGQTGTGIFYYEYDKRDVMAEQFTVDPDLAEAARVECPEEGPSILNHIFDGMSTPVGTHDELEEVRKTAVESIYDFS